MNANQNNLMAGFNQPAELSTAQKITCPVCPHSYSCSLCGGSKRVYMTPNGALFQIPRTETADQ
jgi:hypothetical protein